MKTGPSPITTMESQWITPSAGSTMLQSTLLLFLLAFPVYFMF